MKSLSLKAKTRSGLTADEVRSALTDSISEDLPSLKKVLLIPPDITRFHSMAGPVTEHLYNLLIETCEVDVLPALGTHVPMTEKEFSDMYGSVPFTAAIVHNWRTGVEKIGEIPAEFVSDVSEGLVNRPISVEISKTILDPSYDMIISVGQVVPHEVVGMANYSKNILVGCGGDDMINSSHMVGALHGLERLMGKDHSPVRKILDYSENNFLADLPITYILTVIDEGTMQALMIGRDRSFFEEAVNLSAEKNIIFTDAPFKKAVVYLDPHEFKSTWIGNKAVYRTRMAIADGGDLIILAPGVDKFGEDKTIDTLIRKYGYVGRLKILDLFENNQDLKDNMSAAAHLIHGSSDFRFNISYCTKHLSREEVEGVGFKYMPYDEAASLYDPELLKDGYNTLADGEEVFYISNPALGLWADRKKFEEES